MQTRTWIWGLVACTLAVGGLVGGWQAYAGSRTGDACCATGCCGNGTADCCLDPACPPGCCPDCPPDCCPTGCCQDATAKARPPAETVSDDCCGTNCCSSSVNAKAMQVGPVNCCTK
jgi:hypothetical protein